MDEEVTYAACPISVLDVAIATLASISGWIDSLVDLMCRHANYKVERREMAREARNAIEKIVDGQ